VELHAFTGDWNGNTATWNSLNGITAPAAFGGYTQPAFPGGTRQWAPPISMTSQVQSWVNGWSPNYGFALMLPPQPANWGGPSYASAENTSYPHPFLSVTYEATVPRTPGPVTASAANASAQVNWSPPSSNGGSAIDSYAVNVFNPDGTYANIQVLACGTCTSATIGGLTNGRAYYFGVYAHNIVGYGNPRMSTFVTPAVPPGAPTNLQGTVSTGWYHSLIGRPDGTVAASGLNNVGQLGNNTTVDAKVPTVVPGLSGVTQVEAGYAHSLALRSDGTVWAWGYNNAGELGNNTTVDSPVPVQVPGLSGVVSISTSYRHNLAVKSDGTVWAWGYNSNGQLGNNSTVNSHVPIQVPNAFVLYAGYKMVAVSAGYLHSLTLRQDGTVSAFGLNNYGQLGNNSTIDSHSPVTATNVRSAVAISAGVAHNVVLRGDGAVWTFGYNGHGALGNNTTVNSSVAIVVPGLTGVTAVSAHGGYDSMARKTNGSLWGWGYNGNGQLGNNSTAQSNVPIQMPGQTAVTQASASIYHTMTVKADGAITASGYNAQGQLGNNTNTDALTPVTPAGPGLAPQSATLVAASPARTVNVTWAAPALTGGRPITGYNLTLYKGTPGSGALVATKTCDGPCTAAAFTDLAYSTTYHVTVAAVTGAGTGPAATSNPATTAAMATAGNGEGVIQWTPPTGGDPITGYLIRLFDTSGPTPVLVGTQTVAADQTGLLWTGLTNGTTYAFSIYTQTANGDTLHTTSGNITPDGNILTSLLRPGIPVAQDAQDRQSTVTWAPPGLAVPADLGGLATTYTVRAFKVCDLTSAPAATAQAVQPATGQPTATVTGLKNGTSYCFTVEATNLIILNSSQSPPSNSVIPAGPPFAPINVKADRGDQRAKLTWSAPPARDDGTPGDNGRPITRYDVQILDSGGMIVGTRENVTSGQFIEQLTNGTPYR
ncbi:MAG: fibronectin type III domain-containing protein, partial [Acidimicrobiia bacterium]|nr:fibronectin type III domain-containing protein [Acidimicrobiia bacterium]